MSMHSARMSYGANMGLSRMHCRQCAEETLHKTAKCVHCGTPFKAVIPPSLNSAELIEQIDARYFQIAQAKKRKHRRLSIKP
jgi:hypothetical protein